MVQLPGTEFGAEFRRIFAELCVFIRENL